MPEQPARRRKGGFARSPESLLVASFAGLIAVGTALLALPAAHRTPIGLLDAFFTATSAVCVTGLTVVDTGTAFSPFGQAIILLLIQVGGIGIMTFAALAFSILGRRLSLRAQAALASSMLQRDVASEFRHLLRRILRFVFLAEAAGAVLLFLAMLPEKGVGHAACSAVFHSVSAFCNAGFSLYRDSLMGFRDNLPVLFATMALIILGGLGYPVVMNLWEKAASRLRGNLAPVRLDLNSKVVLATSAGLIVLGCLALFAIGLPADGAGPGGHLMNALFQSVTARTAGFNTVDTGALPLPSLLLLCLLMFVGGSPGSCAGGVKTTTMAMWLSKLWSLLNGGKWPRLLGRHIPGDITRRASLIIGLAVLWNLLGLFVLLLVESRRSGVGLMDVLFEQISAFGTVGLSTGLTQRLSVAGKLWLAATMFVGRLGPLTLAVLAFPRRNSDIRYPEGRLTIG